MHICLSEVHLPVLSIALVQLKGMINKCRMSLTPRTSVMLFDPVSFQIRLIERLQVPEVEALVSFFSFSGLYRASGGIEGVTVQAGG